MLKVHSVFASIDGEVNAFHQGSLTVFIRFAGCNLACSYCDTLFAMAPEQGKDATTEEIMSMVAFYQGIKKVTITGGEPLCQDVMELKMLLRELLSKGYSVTIETNGSYPLNPFFPPAFSEVRWIVDYKLDSSGMADKMNPSAFLHLGKGDFIKFVIADLADFTQALTVIHRFKYEGIDPGVKWAFSPIYNQLPAEMLVGWLINSQVPNACINVQLHKILGLVEPG